MLEDMESGSCPLPDTSAGTNEETRKTNPASLAPSLRTALPTYSVVEIRAGQATPQDWTCHDLLEKIFHCQPLMSQLPQDNNSQRAASVVAGAVQELKMSDLRFLLHDMDPPPHILVRIQCVIVCLPPVRAVLLIDRIFLVISDDLIALDSLVLQLQHLTEEFVFLANFVELWIRENPEEPGLWSISEEEDMTLKPLLHWIAKAPSDGPVSGLESPAMEVVMEAAFVELNDEINRLEDEIHDEVTTFMRRSLFDVQSSLRLDRLTNNAKLYARRVDFFNKSFDYLLTSRSALDGLFLLNNTLQRMDRLDIPAPRDSRLCVLLHMCRQRYGNGREGISRRLSFVPTPFDHLEELLALFDALLEQFDRRIDALQVEVDMIKHRVASRRLSDRLTFVKVDVSATIITMSASLGAYLSGILGMNLGVAFLESLEGFNAILFTYGFNAVFVVGIACTTFIWLLTTLRERSHIAGPQ